MKRTPPKNCVWGVGRIAHSLFCVRLVASKGDVIYTVSWRRSGSKNQVDLVMWAMQQGETPRCTTYPSSLSSYGRVRLSLERDSLIYQDACNSFVQAWSEPTLRICALLYVCDWHEKKGNESPEEKTTTINLGFAPFGLIIRLVYYCFQ